MEIIQSDLGEATYRLSRKKTIQPSPIDKSKVLPYFIELIDNSYKPTKIRYFGNGTWWERSFSRRLSNFPIYGSGPYLDLGPNDLVDLRKRVIDKIRGTKYNLAVNTGEATEAFLAIRQFAETGAQVLIDLRKGRLASAANRIGLTEAVYSKSVRKQAGRIRKGSQPSRLDLDKYMSDAWLQSQLGWGPLFDSAKSSAEFLVDAQQYEPKTVIKVGLKPKKDVVDRIWGNQKGKAFRSVTLRGHVVLQPRSDGINTGFSNPLNVLYALTPGSFILDWFYPFGDIIDQLGAFRDVAVLEACYSVKATQYCRYTPDLSIYQKLEIKQVGDDRLFASRYERTLWDPTVFIPPKPVCPDISGWQITTTIALIRSVLLS